MEIIATTKEGCLIQATNNEAKEILRAVSGKVPDNLEIGQKLPAIDYAMTITKIQSLAEDYDYRQLLSKAKSFTKALENLNLAVTSAKNIEV